MPLAFAFVLALGCAKPDAMPPSSSCPTGQSACGTACFDLDTSAQHCGDCNTSCSAGQACTNGACQCASGFMACGTTCVATSSDHDHCGSCTRACGGTQVCSNGQCSSNCSGGATNCNGSCVDTRTDNNNCNGCGVPCPVGNVCTNGMCGCPVGTVVCNGSCAASCGGGGPGTGGATGTGGTIGTGGRGGVTGQGGTTGQGGATGQGGSTGGLPPPGWWTSGSWHGCTWTAKDIVPNSTTSNNPLDFLTRTSAPYCVSGTVNPTYESVAILGFNLNEAITSSPTQCAYKLPDPTRVGPPGVALTGTGMAISFSRTVGSNLRVQIQGPNGGMSGTIGENDRWCYTITEVQGPVFVPFSRFNTHCWDQTGTAYAGQPISAVSFLVPGLPVPSPFNYCIGGFALGSSPAAAPAYTPSPPNPVVAGTIGGPGPGMDLDFQRVKVSPAGSTKQYILQNNNWGTPTGTDQTISYRANSFTIMSTTGNVTGQGVPASFPSIYIGGNGDTQSANDPPKGVYSTHPSDNLPRAIGQIGTANTTFTWTGGTGNRDFNATYDIWVAQPPAPTSPYSDALDGFVMVWLYQPGRNPIGSRVGAVTIAGTTYDLWVGPRNSGTILNRPVISYVVQGGPVMTKSFDLKPILLDAGTNALIPANMRIPSTWLVTDIFGGFEVWTGSTAAGLSMTNFTVDVVP